MSKALPVITACCLLLASNANAQLICSSTTSDTDGDGWGWENNATCIVSTELPQSTSASSIPVISLEDGTLIPALPFSDAAIADGYAIVTPPDVGPASGIGTIYSRSADTSWIEQASVSVPDFELPDEFEENRGVFAISDSYAVVGVPDYNTSYAGSAHIFARIDDHQWMLDTVLDGYSRPWDFFGKSVAISGTTVAVGSNPGGEASQSGRVSLYSRDDIGWTLDQTIDSSFENPDGFGNSVYLSEDLLLIPYSTDDTYAAIYQRTLEGWQQHSVINGERFALHHDTIVAYQAGDLHTYKLQADNSFQLDSVIDYQNHGVSGIALSDYYLVVALGGETTMHYYSATGSSESAAWHYAGDIDASPSIPIEPDSVFVTVNGISGQSVIVSRGIFPSNSPSSFDAFIIELPESNNGVDTETENTEALGNNEIIVNDSEADLATDSEQPVAACIDTDGDGYGWNGVDTCFPDGVIPVHEPANDSSREIDADVLPDGQLHACVDNDGDGYGWNGVETCFPNGVIPVHINAQTPACIDNDGDGYGWDGVQTCLVAAPVSNSNQNDASAVEGLDADGDSYGWTGTQSCTFNSDGSITLL